MNFRRPCWIAFFIAFGMTLVGFFDDKVGSQGTGDMVGDFDRGWLIFNGHKDNGIEMTRASM
jgi:hypothetical protein